MSKKSFRQAINEALRQEMQRDPRIILMGEDIAGGQGGSAGVVDAWGGVLGVTKGLYTEFGPDRVFDTPISEASLVYRMPVAKGLPRQACARLLN